MIKNYKDFMKKIRTDLFTKLNERKSKDMLKKKAFIFPNGRDDIVNLQKWLKLMLMRLEK